MVGTSLPEGTRMSAQSDVERLRKAAQGLQAKIAAESKKIATTREKVRVAKAKVAKAASVSSVQSRVREADRYTKTAADAEKRRAELEKQLVAKQRDLLHAEAKLERERMHAQLLLLKRLENQERSREQQFRPSFPQSFHPTSSPSNGEVDAPRHDVFISYASEDKEAVARPLAELLRRRGLDVWYDELSLTVGDSLRRNIDRGLTTSRFGVVVLSPDFFRKQWPQSELDGLVARERASGHKVVLPIWHRITKDDLVAQSPTLADKVALNSSVMTLDEIAAEIATAVKGNGSPVPAQEGARVLREIIEARRDEIRATVARHQGVAVAVFGSVARGDADANSDIDLLVDFGKGSSLLDLVGLEEELEAVLGRPVDVVALGSLKVRDKPILEEAVWL